MASRSFSVHHNLVSEDEEELSKKDVDRLSSIWRSVKEVNKLRVKLFDLVFLEQEIFKLFKIFFRFKFIKCLRERCV